MTNLHQHPLTPSISWPFPNHPMLDLYFIVVWLVNWFIMPLLARILHIPFTFLANLCRVLWIDNLKDAKRVLWYIKGTIGQGLFTLQILICRSLGSVMRSREHAFLLVGRFRVIVLSWEGLLSLAKLENKMWCHICRLNQSIELCLLQVEKLFGCEIYFRCVADVILNCNWIALFYVILVS